MKKNLALVVISVLFLTACGRFKDNVTPIKPDAAQEALLNDLSHNLDQLTSLANQLEDVEEDQLINP